MPGIETLIPQSTALAEAGAESLSDLFSRDPEGLSRQDLSRIVDELRKQRVNWEAADAAGKTAPKAKKVTDKAAGLLSSKTANELDL